MALVVADAVHVFQRAALRLANIMQHRSCGRGRGRSSGEPKAFERQHAEMVFHQRDGVVGGEDPIVERGEGHTPALVGERRLQVGALSSLPFVLGLAGTVSPGPIKQRQGRGVENLGVRTGKLGGAKFSGGKIERGESCQVFIAADGRQKIIFFRTQR